VKQDSNTQRSNGANAILGAWRSISQRTRHVLGRVRTDCCPNCLRAIHWWNRRVRLDGEHCAHRQCWKGELFLKALVAEHIRFAQVEAHQNSALPQPHSAEHELQESYSYAIPREQSEQLLVLLQPTDELAPTTRIDESQHNGSSALWELGRHLWHFPGWLTSHWPSRPPRLCMLCGAGEFSKKSAFCTKCGGPLRP
jgi:hypothetical protein